MPAPQNKGLRGDLVDDSPCTSSTPRLRLLSPRLHCCCLTQVLLLPRVTARIEGSSPSSPDLTPNYASLKACIVVDQAYDSNRLVEDWATNEIEAVTPSRACSEPRELNQVLYASRYRVERCPHDIKRVRRIATHAETIARNVAAFSSRACCMLWPN